jgi:short-subunit dehydrogenase
MSHVVVTGASSGIGAALVAEFACSGASVTMVARREAAMTALAARVGGRTQLFAVDLAQPADPTLALAFVGPAQERFGPVDVLINNAGVQIVEPAEEHDPAELLAMLRLNLTVPMLLTRALLPGMLERGRGTIVNVSSMAALAPTPGMWGYNACKGGLAAASESLRGELRRTGVHVLTVYPGPVDTPMSRAGYEAYPKNFSIGLLPQGHPAELARRVRSAVELGQPRLIYPRPYALTRYFPTMTRWFLDQFTPRAKSARQRQPARLPGSE